MRFIINTCNKSIVNVAGTVVRNIIFIYVARIGVVIGMTAQCSDNTAMHIRIQ